MPDTLGRRSRRGDAPDPEASLAAVWHLFSLGLLAWETVCVIIAGITTIGGSPHADVWVLCSALFGALLVATFVIRERGLTATIAPARPRRSMSLYCARCGLIYTVS